VKSLSEIKKPNSFEEAIKELETTVGALETGKLGLDEAILYFQKGMDLSKYCNDKLLEAEKKIKILVEGENGEIKEEDFHGI
jgi:exodeoxyribonuclease VII small subunit